MEDKNNSTNRESIIVNEVRSVCGIGSCPAVFETKKECAWGSCPSVHASESNFLIIGRQLSSEEIEKLKLSKKVGKGETIIEVPKNLLEGL